MNTEIIDHCSDTPKGDPIKLTHCLQSTSKKDGPFFYESQYSVGNPTKIERIASRIEIDGLNYDLIRVIRHDQTNIFLGYWNSGSV